MHHATPVYGSPTTTEQQLPAFALSSIGYNPLFSFSKWLTRIEQGHKNEQFLEISTTQEDQVCRSNSTVPQERIQLPMPSMVNSLAPGGLELFQIN